VSFMRRTLENGSLRLLECLTIDRALEGCEDDSQEVSVVYPKRWYTWNDRAVSAPDFEGTVNLADWQPTPTADAGTLLITADFSEPSARANINVVYWDERGNPLCVAGFGLMASSFALNAEGNYIAGINCTGSYVPMLTLNVSFAAGYTILVNYLTGGVMNLHSKLF